MMVFHGTNYSCLAREAMELKISSITQPQRKDFIDRAKKLLDEIPGALRMSVVFDKTTEQKVLYLRERTWGEFFLEKLILTPQEMEDVQNEALAAIELAFFSIAKEQSGQVENESRKIEKDSILCINDLDNRVPSGNPGDSCDDSMGFDMHESQCKELLRSRILNRDTSDIDMESSKPCHGRTFNGLLTVPKGISVSTCPVLQVIAHNVVVNSVGASSVRNVRPYSALQRALQAFKSALDDLPKKTPPKREGDNVLVYKENLECKAGLRHIQKLMCTLDDRNRHNQDFIALQRQDRWQSFYESCCNAEGSVVLELYPDYYENDQNAPAKKRPFYSKKNIEAAVAAAVKVRENMRNNGKEPVSIMFAGMDQATYVRISNELNNVNPERKKESDKPTINRDKEFQDYFLSPEKFPPAAITNSNLQNAVRKVPEYRRNLKQKN